MANLHVCIRSLPRLDAVHPVLMVILGSRFKTENDFAFLQGLLDNLRPIQDSSRTTQNTYRNSLAFNNARQSTIKPSA